MDGAFPDRAIRQEVPARGPRRYRADAGARGPNRCVRENASAPPSVRIRLNNETDCIDSCRRVLLYYPGRMLVLLEARRRPERRLSENYLRDRAGDHQQYQLLA